MFLVLGLFLGLCSGILLFQLEKILIKCLFISTNGVGVYLAFDSVFLGMSLPVHFKVSSFAVFIVSIVIGVACIFGLIGRQIRQLDKSIPICTIDILLGKNKFIEDYYNTRKNRIDKELNFKELESKEKLLQDKEGEVSRREKLLIGLQQTADEATKRGIFFPLPLNSQIPVSNHFISLLPKYVADYVNFAKVISEGTVAFIDGYKDRGHSDQDFIQGYFYQICSYTAIQLFGSTSDVRVHFRALKSSHYEKLVSSIGSTPYTGSLTPICSQKGMIHAAGTHKRSLIKSLNPSCHEKAEHDHIWEDYMTLVFDRFYKDGRPFLSMGISVKCGSSYNDLFYFLNYCKFEQLIQDELTKVNEVVGIDRVLYSDAA